MLTHHAKLYFCCSQEIRKWKDYVYGEWVFIILSFTAKSFLAWFNYGGANSLKQD